MSEYRHIHGSNAAKVNLKTVIKSIRNSATKLLKSMRYF